jgi:hypothetical protein
MTTTSPIDNFVASGGTSGATAQTNSRYYGIGTTTYTRSDGAIVRYLNRRVIPQPDQYATLRQYVVKEADRIDTVASTQIGDPLLYWILCDANGASDPDALTTDAGRVLSITLPAGIGTTGGASA